MALCFVEVITLVRVVTPTLAHLIIASMGTYFDMSLLPLNHLGQKEQVIHLESKLTAVIPT